MITKRILLILTILALITACGINEEPGNTLSAEVTNVVDGDTIDVRINQKEERVRLLLIDTPETKHPNKGVQPFGPEASDFTTDMLMGKDVQLELDVSERDRYGRILAYVWLDGELFNERLIKEGLARVAIFPPDTKYVDTFEQSQKEAQKKGVGIWSMEDYVEEDRYSDNTNDSSVSDTACIGKIKGNKNSEIYHLPSGAHYDEVEEKNVIWFCTEKDAEQAGYRKSKN